MKNNAQFYILPEMYFLKWILRASDMFITHFLSHQFENNSCEWPKRDLSEVHLVEMVDLWEQRATPDDERIIFINLNITFGCQVRPIRDWYDQRGQVTLTTKNEHALIIPLTQLFPIRLSNSPEYSEIMLHIRNWSKSHLNSVVINIFTV